MREDAQHASSKSPTVAEHPWLTAWLDHVPHGIGLFDGRGTLMFGNRHFARLSAERDGPAVDAPAWQSFSADGHPVAEGVYPCVRLFGGDRSPSDAGTSSAADRLHEPERESPFIAFAKSSANAIMIIDPEGGTIDYLNPAADVLWADSVPQITLLDWEASIHPDDRRSAWDRRQLARDGETQRFEYRIVSRAGDVTRQVRECCFPIIGHSRAIGAIVEDITPAVQIYVIRPDAGDEAQLLDELRLIAHDAREFATAQSFLDVADVLRPGCVIVDLRGSATHADQILGILALRPGDMRVILIGPQDTAASQVMAAIKAGVSDYLVDPVEPGTLQASVQQVCRPLWDWHAHCSDQGQATDERLLDLPRREREVLLGLVAGGTNKVIARSLKLSPRTVEVHRAHLMQRLNVRTLTELLRLAHRAGLHA